MCAWMRVETLIAFFLCILLSSLATEPLNKNTFETVASQTCTQTKTSENYFQFLGGCAVYNPTTIENLCLNESTVAAEVKLISEWTLTIDKVNGDSLFRSFDFNDFQVDPTSPFIH